MIPIIAMSEHSVGTGVGPEAELAKAEFFRALPPEELRRVLPLLHHKRFEKQAVLFFEGHPAEYLWVLERGEVRLYKSSPGGQLTTLEVLGPGEMFGATSALDQPAYPASAEAVDGGSAWCLPRRHVLRLLERHPVLAVEILQVVSRRLRDAHERLRSFAHDTATQRLARALLRASSGGEARVTRRALAEASGTTVETAIRVLRRLEREGLIRGEVGRIHVLDEPGLWRVAGGTSDA